MKIYLVCGEHPRVDGIRTKAFVTPEGADGEARILVNLMRHDDEIYIGDEDEPITFEELTGAFDWRAALANYQRLRMLEQLAGPTEVDRVYVASMDDDALAAGAGCSVWIEEQNVTDAPAMAAVIEDVISAGAKAREYLDDANDPAATALGTALGDALQMLTLASIAQGKPGEQLAALYADARPALIASWKLVMQGFRPETHSIWLEARDALLKAGALDLATEETKA